jgi:hypothetical protein
MGSGPSPQPNIAATWSISPETMTWPKPAQKTHPPILVGGAFPQAARRVIRCIRGSRRCGSRLVPPPPLSRLNTHVEILSWDERPSGQIANLVFRGRIPVGRTGILPSRVLIGHRGPIDLDDILCPGAQPSAFGPWWETDKWNGREHQISLRSFSTCSTATCTAGSVAAIFSMVHKICSRWCYRGCALPDAQAELCLGCASSCRRQTDQRGIHQRGVAEGQREHQRLPRAAGE